MCTAAEIQEMRREAIQSGYGAFYCADARVAEPVSKGIFFRKDK